MSSSSIIEQIKDRVLCTDYMEREHGAVIRGGRCKSFRPEATNSTSMLVNERDWCDYGNANKGGDIINLVMEDRFPEDPNAKGKAIKWLCEYAGIENESVPHIDRIMNAYFAILDETASFYQTCLGERQKTYLRERGLNDDTISALRIGWSDNPFSALLEKGFTKEQISESGVLSFINRLMIPYLKNGKTQYLIGRTSVFDDLQSNNPEAKYMKLFRSELSDHPIWGIDSLSRKGPVIVAEGIFDAISCWQEGFPVISAITGAFSAEQKKELFSVLRGRKVIVCMDYDPVTHAGQKFTSKLASELFEHHIPVSVCYISGDGEKVDINELYSKNPCRGTLDIVFDDAESWQQHEVRRISMIEDVDDAKKELNDFLVLCSTVLQGADLEEISEYAQQNHGHISKPWVKALCAKIKKAPSELIVMDRFIEKYKCIFSETLGWYEYSGTVWKKVSEYYIRKLIMGIYGNFANAKNVEACYKLLKTTVSYTERLDSHTELLNLQNGMLNVETLEVTPHDEKLYSSIQLDYGFDKDASCPKWIQFIEDITDGDEARANLIQEMFGYCLTKDVRYQKCFCLIGSGANGKSVLLSVLEKMLCSKNVSHVEIAHLSSDFQRILLMSSMVNICNDMKSDVSGTESYLKSIVSGDPISGCYKGKDFVSFSPFCKIVFSTNQMVTSKEVDYSVMRRFVFISFPVTFVDENPDESKHEKLKNQMILDDLETELPGILNWSLCGLKALRTQNKFTETFEQSVLAHDMQTMNDPLIEFVEDKIGSGAEKWINRWCTRDEVYMEYKSWCERFGHETARYLSPRQFYPKLRSIFPFIEKHGSENKRMIYFTDPLKFKR